MPTISVGGPTLDRPLRLRWICRKCGKRDGYARALIPIMDDTRAWMSHELRKKVARYHTSHDKCMARPDEFVFLVDY